MKWNKAYYIRDTLEYNHNQKKNGIFFLYKGVKIFLMGKTFFPNQ